MPPLAIHTLRDVAPDTDLIGCYIPVPGMGHVAVNAFLLRAAEPILVDAGIVRNAPQTLDALSTLLDLDDLRWIYLTHVDADHVGCLDELLRLAPHARIVSTYVGMSKLAFTHAIPPERFHLLNPGQALVVGDRSLWAATPPCYDAPETTMLWNPRGSTLFSSDCFGALVPEQVEHANDVNQGTLREGMVAWLTVDSPWVHAAMPAALERAARAVTDLGPTTILSAHLAPATQMASLMAESILLAREATPFVGPDQAAFLRAIAASS